MKRQQQRTMTGGELKALREHYRLTQNDVALALDLGRNTRISEYETVSDKELPLERSQRAKTLLDAVGKHYAYICDTLADHIHEQWVLADDETRKRYHFQLVILQPQAYENKTPHPHIPYLHEVYVPYATYVDASMAAHTFLVHTKGINVSLVWLDERHEW